MVLLPPFSAGNGMRCWRLNGRRFIPPKISQISRGRAFASSSTHSFVTQRARVPLSIIGERSSFLSSAASQLELRPHAAARNYWWPASKPKPAGDLETSPVAPSTIPSTAELATVPPSEMQQEIMADAGSTTDSQVEPMLESIPEAASDIPIDMSLIPPPPLQLGDLTELGLTGWSPSGIIRSTLEMINVSTGLPWFYTIVAGTLLFRAIIFPLAVAGLRNSARLQPFAPRLQALSQETLAARASRDVLAMQRLALKQKQVYEEAGVKMGPSMLAPFVQLPVTLGLFFGIKGLCQYPVEQLKYSGLAWLPDLTVPDPYFILPALAAALINMQIVIGAKEMNTIERPGMGHLMNGMRVLSIASIYFMGTLPSGVMVSLVTGISAMTLQSFLLQKLPIRRAFNIPVVPTALQGRIPTFQSTIQYLKKWWQDKAAEAQAQHLAKQNAGKVQKVQKRRK